MIMSNTLWRSSIEKAKQRLSQRCIRKYIISASQVSIRISHQLVKDFSLIYCAASETRIMNALEYQQNPKTSITLNPEQWGFHLDNDQFFPSTQWKNFYPQRTLMCSCGVCTKTSCPCRKSAMKCCTFCKCKKDSDTCKNPFVWSL